MVSQGMFRETADGLGYGPKETAAAWGYVSGNRAEVGLDELHKAANQSGQHRGLIEDVAKELDN